jgi:FkbM family methyltransferase
MTAAEFIYTVLLRPRPLKNLANSLLRLIVKPELRIHGAVVALNPADPVVSGALTLGVYERAETRFFRLACRPGMIFLDVGANVGYYTALAMHRVQASGAIVAMEPDPDSFSYLLKTVGLNGQTKVTCVRKAAAAETGEATLFVSRDNRGDNRLYPSHPGTDSIRVLTITVDDLLAELGIRQVNLVKVDVQGFEGHVLHGMERTIVNSPSLIILMEFWPQGLRAAGSEPGQIFTWCLRLGLQVFTLARDGHLQMLECSDAVIRDHPGRKYTNLVAIKGVSFLDELTSRRGQSRSRRSRETNHSPGKLDSPERKLAE